MASGMKTCQNSCSAVFAAVYMALNIWNMVICVRALTLPAPGSASAAAGEYLPCGTHYPHLQGFLAASLACSIISTARWDAVCWWPALQLIVGIAGILWRKDAVGGCGDAAGTTLLSTIHTSDGILWASFAIALAYPCIYSCYSESSDDPDMFSA